MRRDPELIRRILLAVETGQDVRQLPGYTEDEFNYHAAQAVNAGLVVGQISGEITSRIRQVVMYDLTPAGHDLLDAIRSDTIWRKTLDKVEKEGGGWTLDILKALATSIVKAHLGLP